MSTTHVPAIDMNKLNAFIGQFVTDLGAAVHAGMVVIGEKLGLYKALAEKSAELRATCRQDPNRRTLSARVAGFTSRRRLHHLRRQGRQVQPDCRAGLCLGNRRQSGLSCPGHLNWLWARLRRFRGSPNPSAPEPAWVGTNMWTAYSMAAKSSFARLCGESCEFVDTGLARRQGKAGGGGACGRRRLRQGRFHHFDGESIPQLPFLRIRLPRQVDRSGARVRSAQRCCRPRDLCSCRRKEVSRQRVTISWQSSIVCTIWETRSARLRTSGSHWPRMVPG